MTKLREPFEAKGLQFKNCIIPAATTHLRGTAGEQPVERARLASTHMVGVGPGIGVAGAIHIFEGA